MALNIGTDDYSEYDPEYCEGHYCPKDCSHCSYREELREGWDEEDDS